VLVELGHFSLILALAVHLLQSVLPVYGCFVGDRRIMKSSVPIAYLGFLLIAFPFFVLIYCYVISDFSVANVVQNSFSEKPLLFKITGVWGNHEGSMLLWVVILSFFSALVGLFGKALALRLKTLVLSCQSLIASAFLLFILLTSNPFLRQNPPALQGRDLNPILQDIGLAIHPPLLYLGYVGFSVCFSFAIAALIDGHIDAVWGRWVRPWALISWFFLTGGIVMGSYWAYYELGWGGYWFWDPVENASLLPWLAGTALLHSAIVMEKRGALKIWTLFLAISTFSLSLMGTFLVRSGILSSVHSFATDPRRGLAILAILIFFIGAALLLFAFRASALKTGGLFRPISREGALVFNNLFLTCALSTVLIGTLYPLLLETLTGDKISVGAPFYNLAFVPLMVPVLFFMPFGPLLAWKRGDIGAVCRRLAIAFIIFVVAIVFTLVKTSFRDVLSALGIGLSWFIIAGAVTDLIAKTGQRSTSFFVRLRRFFGLPGAVFGTALAHIGIGLTLLGIITVSTFSQEQILILKNGDSTSIAGRTLQLKGARLFNGPNYNEKQFDFSVSENGQPVAFMTAAKRFYPAQQMPTTEAGILSDGFSQIYIAPGSETDNGLTVHIWWKPRVIFIWFGGIVMMLGGLCSLCDRRFRIGAPQRKRKLT